MKRFSAQLLRALTLLGITAVLSLAVDPAAAQNVSGDFDGDGRADLTTVRVDRSRKRTTFAVASSSSGLLSYRLDEAGDALVTGRFFGGAKTYPGIVTVRSADEPLEWRILSPNGRVNEFSFGEPGDTIPNQGDLDCDGVTDYIAVRRATGKRNVWLARLSGSGRGAKIAFGSQSDKLFVADVTGDGCAELIALSTKFVWQSRSIYSSSIVQKQWGQPGDYPLLPQDINGDTLPDYIVVRDTAAKTQQALISLSPTQELVVDLARSGYIPFVGTPFGPNMFGVWNRSAAQALLKTGDGSFFWHALGSATSALVRADGTVIQPSESGRFGSSDGGAASIPGGCSRPKFPDGYKRGWTWKPVKDGGFHTPGGPVVIVPKKGRTLSSSVEIYSREGRLVNEALLRYHNGSSGGRSYWDPTKTAKQLSPDKPLTVRTRYADGSCEDRTVPDPTERAD